MTRDVTTGWRLDLEGVPGDRIALIFEDRTILYTELLRDVDAMSRRLAAESIVCGSRVGLLAPPSASGVALIHAMLERGIVMVPLNLRWTLAELRDVAEATGLDWIVVATQTQALGQQVAEDIDCGLLWLSSSASPIPAAGESAPGMAPDPDSTVDRVSPEIERLRSSSAGVASSTRSEAAAECGERSASMPDAALILFTSGTSGRPKAAALSLGNLRASATASIELLGSDPRDRWLCCMPLFHIGGLSILIRSVLAGSCVVLHAQFDAPAVARSLEG